jgi:cobalt-precorrin-5B (C1)-methyltransferase
MTHQYPIPPRNRQGQRAGYTTGSNAAAAAQAATLALLTGQWPTSVTITLPDGDTTTMRPVECCLTSDTASCCMLKDAGDDPDVTHGALICAEVRRSTRPGITLEGGVGVGRVTLPGLGLEVGGPAINPVPRRQILDNVTAACPANFLERQGLEVIISVPDGAALAEKTLNARLGIIGGISILGTTGKVFPYSTAAWRASVTQAIEVAAANGVKQVVLASGGRSERFALGLFPELPAVAFIELSVFTGEALKTCLAQGLKAAVLVFMISRVVKTAQGEMMTHVAGSQVDFEFLAQVCRDSDAPPGLVEAVATANTSRHFLELCRQWDYLAPVERLVKLALAQAEKFIVKQGGSLALEVILVDFDGTVLGRVQSSAAPLAQ